MKNIVLNILMIGSLLAAASCGSRQSRSADEPEVEGMLIVASKSGNDVYFIDRQSGETLTILPTGLQPHEVEVSDDGRIAVVCNYGDRENAGNTLTVYNVTGLSIEKTIDLGSHTRPHGMQWVAGTNNLLVTTEGSNSLLVVDVKAGEVIQVMDTKEEVSHMVAATPDFSRAFVPSIRTGNVAVFDMEADSLISHVYSGEGAEGIDVSPDGAELWVTNRDENTITIFDTQSLQVLARLPCDDFPIRAKFTPDGSRFLVSNARSGTIAVFDARNRVLEAQIRLTPPVPDNRDAERYFAEFEETSIPIGIVVPDNRFAYVANTRSDVVSVIDLETMEISGHIDAGREPDGINFSHLKPQ
ncbi:MAG: YncE family protein [Bacteroidota bacterium]